MGNKIGNAIDVIARGSATTLGAEEIKAVRGIVGVIASLMVLAGITLAYFGILLVSEGAQNVPMNFKFLGISIKTSSVGVAAIAIGAALIILTVRRLINVLIEAVRR